MTASEKLRQEMEQNAPFTKQEFIEVVTSAIKKNGAYQYVLDARASKGAIERGSIPTRYHELIRKWAEEEGFTITRYTNYYGVPEFDITL